MNCITEDIKDLLVLEGLGVFAGTNPGGWGIYIGSEPESPDAVITLYDNGPLVSQWNNGGDPLLGETLQVRVRHLDYRSGYSKVMEIMNYLIGLDPYSVVNGTVQYKGFVVESGPFELGQDDKRRQSWSLNMRVYRQDGSSQISS